MNWITGALLALYLFFCGFYAWVLARRSGSAHKGALCLAASLALPVAGLVFSVIYFMKKYRLTEEENARISEALRQRKETRG